jgi:hypothetical protein
VKRLALLAVVLVLAALTPKTAAGLGAERQSQPAAAPPGGVVATILVDPLRVSLSLQTARPRVGAFVSGTEAVTNHSTTVLSGVVATLKFPLKVVVKPSASQFLGILPPGATTTARWLICATAPGTYRIVAEATAQDAAYDHFVTDSQPTSLVVTDGKGRC